MIKRILAIAAAAAAFVAAIVFLLGQPVHSSMLLINATIYTLDPAMPKATAVAIRGNHILRAGSTDELLRLFPADTVIDCSGMTILPGLTDAHAHMNGLGMYLRSIMLAGAPSPDSIIDEVRNAVHSFKAGEWIYGRGWDQNLWPVKEFPSAEMLDPVTPDNPVVLVRIDGHASWVNSAALRIAGISRETPDPEGGRIIRDAGGEPTGVFLDNARGLVESRIPPVSREGITANLRKAAAVCAEAGLTEVGDMGVDSDEIGIYEQLADEHALPIRIYAAVSAPGATWLSWQQRGPEIRRANGMFTLRAMKLYTDGALGSRGAALVEPYSDDPGNRGLTEISDTDLDANISAALNAGFQTCIHAIGDRGNHMALNAFGRAGERIPLLRPRIEHAQVILPDDIPRFHALGVIPSMQPVHATSDMPWAQDRIGPVRIRGAYAWRSLLNAGSIIPAGSDFPNDGMYPLWGFYAAVTRTDRQGNPSGGWFPEQRMTRGEALRAYTQWAAYAAFEEDVRGTIEPGKWADLTVLSDDIMTIPPARILSTDVMMTVVGGTVVYRNPSMHRH